LTLFLGELAVKKFLGKARGQLASAPV